jgi:glycosyltransferase involved in cell wall biosynthesis
VLTVSCDLSRLQMERPAGAAVYASYVVERLLETGEVRLVGGAESRHADAILNLDGRFRSGRGQPVVSAVLDLGHLFARQAYGPLEWMLQNWRVASMARRSDHLLVPSGPVRSTLERYLGVREERVTVLEALPAPTFKRPPRAEVEQLRYKLGLPDRYFLFVGVRSRRKNLPLLAAARKLAGDSLGAAGLVLAGPGRLTLPDSVDLGYVPGADLPALLGGALAWLNPSHYEGSAIGALEAMACGTPALVAATGAQAHGVGMNGMVLPPDDASEWSKALVEVATHPTSRGLMSAAGLRRIGELKATGSPVAPLVSALSGKA